MVSCEMDWFSRLENHLGKDYVTVATISMWEIRLFVAVKKVLAHKITQAQEGTEATGVAGVMGNKGGVGVAFRYERTTMCFICAHLAAHQEKTQDRNSNVEDILRDVKLRRDIFDTPSSVRVCVRFVFIHSTIIYSFLVI